MRETTNKLQAKADELSRAESEIARLEDEIREAKERKEQIEREMPELMDEEGVGSFETTDGRVFRIRQSVFVNLTKDKREEFCRWAEEHGNSGIVKRTVTVPFGAGDSGSADEFVGSPGTELEFAL